MPEAQHIEWKERWRDDFLRRVCGYANAEGGSLHIGRNDKGVVVGVADAKIQRIVDACKAAGAPKPRITHEHNDLWLELPFTRAYLQLLETGSETPRSGETPVTGSVKTPVNTPVKTPVKILDAFRTHPEATLSDVATAIGKSLRAVERAVAKLRLAGRLRYVGPAKGGHWQVLP